MSDIGHPLNGVKGGERESWWSVSTHTSGIDMTSELLKNPAKVKGVEGRKGVQKTSSNINDVDG